MFDGEWRGPVERVVDPIGVGLDRMGVTANALTVLGVLAAAGSAVLVGGGRLRLGALGHHERSERVAPTRERLLVQGDRRPLGAFVDPRPSCATLPRETRGARNDGTWSA